MSENAFGVLAQKFKILLRTIKSSPENVDYIISAACVLHNFIRQRNDKCKPNKYNYRRAFGYSTYFKFFTASREKSNK
jgi:hypothetical protein